MNTCAKYTDSPLGNEMIRLMNKVSGFYIPHVKMGEMEVGCDHLSTFVECIEKAGLFLEIKTETGTTSQSQKDLHPILRQNGYQVEVVRSFEQFKIIINEYLK